MAKYQKQQPAHEHQQQGKRLSTGYITDKTIRKQWVIDFQVLIHIIPKITSQFGEKFMKLVMREPKTFQILCCFLIKRMNRSRAVHSKRRLKLIYLLWKFIKNVKIVDLLKYKIIVAIHNFFIDDYKLINVRQKEIQVRRKTKFQTKHKSIVLGKRGLQNLGNTCFMNSALQCLYKTQQLQVECRYSLKTLKQNQGPLIYAYVEICDELQKSNSFAYKPQKIRQIVAAKNYVFQEFRQADACEWISTFINTLSVQTNQIKQISHIEIDDYLRRSEDKQKVDTLWEQSKKKDKLREKSIIDDLIYGRYKVTYKCLKCKKQSYNKHIQYKGLYTLFQKYHIVYLPIPSKKTKSQLTLQDSFDQFYAVEKLEGQNKMNCDECMDEQDTQKQMSLYETNKILILCMKRFDKISNKKREIKVQMKLESQFMKKYGQRQDDVRYSLYGMINHYGSLESGHYTATCFDSTNGWVCYNDSYCKDITEMDALKSARSAYVLFYRKV